MAAKEGGIIVLSFQDSLLRKSDLGLLEEGRWINDKLIGFVFEYFTHEQFHSASSDVAFISPDVTQFLKLCQGPDVAVFLEPLSLPSRKLIFFVVNDSESRDSSGGSHWSVLVYFKKDNTFKHYDSCSLSNHRAARDLASNVTPHLGASPHFMEASSPQQQNSFDCGIYAICTTEHLCYDFLVGNRAPLKQAVTPEAVAKKRTDLKELIQRLGREV